MGVSRAGCRLGDQKRSEKTGACAARREASRSRTAVGPVKAALEDRFPAARAVSTCSTTGRHRPV